MKKNNTWTPYKEFGSFFKLKNSVLLGCPMNSDETRSNSPFDVDFKEGVEEKDQRRMKEIVTELQLNN